MTHWPPNHALQRVTRDAAGLIPRRSRPKRALSGFGQDEDVRRSRDAGFATHLTKPVNFQTLHEVIRKVTG